MRTHLDLQDAIIGPGAQIDCPTLEFREDSQGRCFEEIQALNAQHYGCFNAEQTKKRMRSRMFADFWTFAAPLGYKFQKTEARGTVIVWDEPMASVIQVALVGFASGRFMDSIVDVQSDTAIPAYEWRIAKLENDKLIKAEKLAKPIAPYRGFEDMFELALTFLASLWKLWASDKLEDKRTVLKLAFEGRLAYCRKDEFRISQASEPFRFLGLCGQNHEMADREGFEPSIRLPVYTRSRRAPSTTRPPVH